MEGEERFAAVFGDDGDDYGGYYPQAMASGPSPGNLSASASAAVPGLRAAAVIAPEVNAGVEAGRHSWRDEVRRLSQSHPALIHPSNLTLIATMVDDLQFPVNPVCRAISESSSCCVLDILRFIRVEEIRAAGGPSAVAKRLESCEIDPTYIPADASLVRIVRNLQEMGYDREAVIDAIVFDVSWDEEEVVDCLEATMNRDPGRPSYEIPNFGQYFVSRSIAIPRPFPDDVLECITCMNRKEVVSCLQDCKKYRRDMAASSTKNLREFLMEMVRLRDTPPALHGK